MEDRPRSTEDLTGFSLAVSRQADTETIVVVGKLDLARAGRLEEAIRNAEAGSATRIVIDLASLSFVDRPSLAVLLKARARLRASGERLQIVPPLSEAVQRVIALTGTAEMLYGPDPD